LYIYGVLSLCRAYESKGFWLLAWVRGQRKKSRVLGVWAAGFHYVTARSRLARVLKLTNPLFLIFQIFFSGHGKPLMMNQRIRHDYIYEYILNKQLVFLSYLLSDLIVLFSVISQKTFGSSKVLVVSILCSHLLLALWLRHQVKISPVESLCYFSYFIEGPAVHNIKHGKSTSGHPHWRPSSPYNNFFHFLAERKLVQSSRNKANIGPFSLIFIWPYRIQNVHGATQNFTNCYRGQDAASLSTPRIHSEKRPTVPLIINLDTGWMAYLTPLREKRR
jgi:hypothetical protein